MIFVKAFGNKISVCKIYETSTSVLVYSMRIILKLTRIGQIHNYFFKKYQSYYVKQNYASNFIAVDFISFDF